MTSSRVIICQLGGMGKLEKVLDTNMSHIKASSGASLDDKAVSDDNLASEESKHERKKGCYIRQIIS